MNIKRDGGAGEQAMEKAHEIGDNLRDIGAIVREAVDEKLQDVVRGFANAGAKGRDKAAKVGDELAGYVSDRPIRSVLIAASVGFVLGKILRAR